MGIGTAYSKWVESKPHSLPPVIYACGPETSLKTEMVQQLTEWFPAENRNLMTLYADESSPRQVIRECSSGDLFHESKWILLKQLSLDEHGQSMLERYYDDLAAYINDPDSGTVLILFDEDHPYQSGRKTGSMARLVEENGGQVVVFWEPFERELYERVRDKLKQKNLEWDPGVVEWVVEQSQEKWARIDQETDKIVTLKDDGDRITLEDVREIVSEESATDTYAQLKDDMVSGDLPSLFETLEEFYRRSSSFGNVVSITSTLLQYLYELREIRKEVRNHTSLEEALEQRGIPTSKGVKKRYNHALRRLTGTFPRDFFRRAYKLTKDVKYRAKPMNRRALEQYMIRTLPNLVSSDSRERDRL